MKAYLKLLASILSLTLFAVLLVAVSISSSGCSAGGDTLLSITPQQYFYSAKEQLETIDERNYEIRDLDEVIRVLQNAEKDATGKDIMDKSRLYLVLANCLKAKKLYKNNLVEGKYIAGRPAPFYQIDLKEVKETLRESKKWLNQCEANFASPLLQADLEFVKALHYQLKMLTQTGKDREESLEIAVYSFKRCLGIAPEYESDFRLFRWAQTPREVRLKLIETLALGGHQADALGLLYEFKFAPISPISGSTSYRDFSWHHMNGFVLAMMGNFDKAIEVLEPFKTVSSRDYPLVDEALWVLEGVYDYLAEQTKDRKWELEARIVAALQKKLEGPFSTKQYSTSAHLFPRFLPGDKLFFSAALDFYEGKFESAVEKLQQLSGGGILSRSNQIAAKLMEVEAMQYSGKKISDDLLEDMIGIAQNTNITLLQKERAAFLLASYLMDKDVGHIVTRVNHDGQRFIRSLTEMPWALKLKYKRGEIIRQTKPLKDRTEEDEEKAEKKSAELIMEVYANRPQDWIVSSVLHIVSLPDFSLISNGKIVGREDEEKGWLFADEQIDTLQKNKDYLAVLEFDNSDNDTFLQGYLFRL